MSDGLTRRDLVALAGAGTAVSACAIDSMDAVVRAQGRPADECDRLKIRGLCERWGRYAIERPEELAFDPGYIAIVVIDLSERWRLSINHASFELFGKSDPDSRLHRALDLLQARRDLGKNERFFRTLAGNANATLQPYQRQNKKHDLDDFSEYGFATQNEIFIHFNAPDDTVMLNPNWLITFTPKSETGVEAARNYSFLFADEVAQEKLKSIGGGKMIRVRNYLLDCKGKPIGKDCETKSQTYSMNIHFKLKSGGKAVSMIIDPDTGNGVGNEP